MSETHGTTPTAGAERTQELHQARIGDYALIGDLETAALVSREGSIDWLCWPTFSSNACFAALLGTVDHGYWKIFPKSEGSVAGRRYKEGTLIVETRFATPGGEVVLVDFMPPRGERSDIVRIVRGLRGSVDLRMELVIRFEYGMRVPWVTQMPDGLRAVAGADMLVLRTEAPLHGEGLTTVSEFTVHEGQSMHFVLTSSSSMEAPPKPVEPEVALRQTEEFWTDWIGKSTFAGEYKEVVDRSLLTLKALTYRPSGGIVAAPTMGLPEQIGGERNWDYRYCWLRDTAFTLLVLIGAGFHEEAIAWRKWLLRAVAGSPDQLQTLYGICGERMLREWEATWLPGYRNSRPVRVGNAAVSQFQLDVFGEVAAALSQTPDAESDIRVDAGAIQSAIIDHLCHVWQQPDDGIWETRGGRKQFVHSKVMAWVALDRAIRHREQFDGGGDGDVERWKQNREMIHKEVCEKGFDKELNSFVQSYGSKELDASLLRIPISGFLPPHDPRVIGTVEAIERKLMRGGFVERYKTGEDGLKGSEGVFLACSFWLVIALYLIGREQDARELFDRLLGLLNDVGLISEEYSPETGEMLGNFPQALTHLALVHAAFVLSGRWSPESSTGSCD